MRKEISNLTKGIMFMFLWTFSLSIFAQNITVKGFVADADNEPLIGATIKVLGTSTGTVTDIDGNFTIPNVPPNATLEISYVGMTSQTVAVNRRTTINIVLVEDSKQLEEVIIVGYGAQKKGSLVGSIAQTSSEDIKKTGGVTNLAQALTGQLPGVVTLTSTGEPGGVGIGANATQIFIRGQNTWNGGQPLILVDGVERSMENIDVDEVETISVLKDASATAVFGVKGANGVILITTKRGRVGKAEMSVTYNATALMVSRLPEKLDSYDALRLKNEMIEREVSLNSGSWSDYTPLEILNRYRRPQSAEYAEIYPNVNWSEAMFDDVSMSHRTAFNVRGGTDFVEYFGSVAYLHEGDMFRHYDNFKGYDPNYNFDRFNFRTNLGFNLTKTTKLKADLSGYYSTKNTNYSYRQESSSNGHSPDVWAAAYAMPPDAYIPQYSDGYWGGSFKVSAQGRDNPIALFYNTGIMTYKTTSMNSNFSLQQELDFITKGLKAEASFFYDNSVVTRRQIHDGNHVRVGESNVAYKIIDPSRYKGPGQDPSEYTTYSPTTGNNKFDWVMKPWDLGGEEMQNDRIFRRMMYQMQVNYNRSFGLHNVGALGVFKREEFATGSKFKTYREDWVFRTTYDYDGRYLFEANGAYNGSEKFGPGYRFDFFPSVAVGYYVSNEKFWKIDFMNRLKLRYNIGWVGDDQGGDKWAYANSYDYGRYARMNTVIKGPNPDTPSAYPFYRQTVVGNPNIRWETAKKQNLGAEMGFFKDMVSVNIDLFNEHRTNILVSNRRDIASYFGAKPPASNMGEVKAKGYEIEVKFNHQFRDVFLWSNFSITHTENKVIKNDDPPILASHRKGTGSAIGQNRWLINDGFYNNWDDVFASTPTETNDNLKMPGYYHILDFDGNGVISLNGDDPRIGYSTIPQNTYNFSIGAEYKNFSLMLQFFGVNNVTRYAPQNNFANYQSVLFEHALDYWSKDNMNATSFLPRWKTWNSAPADRLYIGDYFIFDGSFVRLKTAELAYKFDKKLLSSVGVSALRLFVNGNNLLFWSKLPDDRESYAVGGEVGYGAYPTPRRINFGLEVTF